MVTLVGLFFTETDILTTRSTQGPAAVTGTFLSLVSSWRRQLARVSRLGKEQETLLTSLPFPLSFLSLTLPILPHFSSPPVPDAGIWSKGLSLSWGLETDHLLLAENSNSSSGLVWVLVGPSSSPPFSGGPGQSPIRPEYLQVTEDVCKATPFAPLSRLLPLLLSTWLPFPTMKIFEDLRYFPFLGSEVLCLYRKFSERLYSCI